MPPPTPTARRTPRFSTRASVTSTLGPSALSSSALKSHPRFCRLLFHRGIHHPFPLLAVLLSLILLVTRPHYRPVSSPPSAARTSAGSPLLPLPSPHGVAAPVMAAVLPRVRQLVAGGSALDYPLLAHSVDARHRHGRLLGYHPLSRKPKWIPTPFNFSEETLDMKRDAHTNTCFNTRRSNSLHLDRHIPDVRDHKCHAQWYYDEHATLRTTTSRGWLYDTAAHLGLTTSIDDIRMPNTSIVFVFYNEPLSTLLRSIHSVLDRTPPQLLHEIILVDDGSDSEAPWLAEGAELEKHIQLLPKTLLARCRGRNGLMRARNIGASVATGQTVTFLDSHIEVNEGWLEPLMGRIAEGWRDAVEHVVVPVIDAIDADTFAYTKGGIDILGHTWGLGQTGVSHALDGDDVSPMQSPIMAGGLLSLSRDFFDKLGFYDPEMELWGGEEMEISFRIWLCGGSLECMPCSHVGHVFRSPKYWQGQVYKVPGEVIARNKLRASFWMQEYGELARLSVAPLKDGKSLGSMKHYKDIQKRLHCKPYKWYLENVYPSMLSSANKMMNLNPSGRTFLASGYMKNPKFAACLDSLHNKGKEAVYGVYPCHYQRGSQSAIYTHSNLILQGEHLLEGCLTRSKDSKLTRKKCTDESMRKQSWEMEHVTTGQEKVVRIIGEGLCLTVVQQSEASGKSALSLRMMECGGGFGEEQEWVWESMQKT